MGSLLGHLIPGMFFLIFGVWWILISFWSHLTTASKPVPAKASRTRLDSGSGSASYADFKRDSMLSRLSYIPQPFCAKVPLEPFMKIGLPLVGILVEVFFEIDPTTGKPFMEVWTLHKPDGSFNELSRLHHLTMYSIFMLSGLVDIAMIFLRLPVHTSKLFLVQAFFVEGVLFIIHALDKDQLNLIAHVLLSFAVFAAGLFAALRMWRSNNLLVNAGLGMSVTLQALWIIEVGAILFGGKDWDTEDHNNSMFLAACFMWNLAGIALVMLVLYVVMMACLRSSVKYRRGRRRAPLRTILPSLPLYPQNGDDSPEREKLMTEEKELNDMSSQFRGSSEKKEDESVA